MVQSPTRSTGRLNSRHQFSPPPTLRPCLRRRPPPPLPPPPILPPIHPAPHLPLASAHRMDALGHSPQPHPHTLHPHPHPASPASRGVCFAAQRPPAARTGRPAPRQTRRRRHMPGLPCPLRRSGPGSPPPARTMPRPLCASAPALSPRPTLQTQRRMQQHQTQLLRAPKIRLQREMRAQWYLPREMRPLRRLGVFTGGRVARMRPSSIRPSATHPSRTWRRRQVA